MSSHIAYLNISDVASAAELSSVTDSRCFYDVEEKTRDDDDCLLHAENLTTSGTIYGRTGDQLQLLKAYQKVIQTQQAQYVVVHGESGSGKTSLVNTLRDPVLQSGGYFVTGKFFQGADVQEPHSAIVAAFSDVCDLIAQSDDLDENRRREIQLALESDGQLLKRFISNLAPFLGSDPPTGHTLQNHDTIDVFMESTLAQFKLACKIFLRAMASREHPLVIVIDDIQWMDEGSKLLIEMFLHDADLKHVMLILCYRDEEDDSVVDLLDRCDDERLVNISLQSLDVSSVHLMVTELLESSSHEIRALSGLVAKRSNGNPFHVLLFIETIQRSGLLVKGRHGRPWVFDIHKIQEEVMVSGTTADLLARKLLNVSTDVQETLKLASLIGYSFDSALLITVLCRLKMTTDGHCLKNHHDERIRKQTILKSLDDAVTEGFLEETHTGHHFTHDRVQFAFQSMIKSTHEKQQLHFLIGEAFLANDCRGYSAYNAAVHLNCAPEFMRGRQQREKLGRINLEAAKHCQEKAAFGKAVVMLRTGLAALNEQEKWTTTIFPLTYEMTEKLAKMELIVGNFEACKKAAKETLDRGTTTEMKINSLLVDVEARMTAFELDSAVVAAFNALQVLAVKMPRKVSIGHVAWKLGIVKRLLWNKSNEDILSLPVMRDKSMSAAVRILVHLCTYCLLNNKTNEAMYSALLAIQITLKGGLSSSSANALAIYGVAEVALGNYDKGYRFGQLALSLLDRMRSKDAECATVGFTLTLLSFWKESLHALPGRLFQAGTSGYEKGDILYATYCTSQAYIIEYQLGRNLSSLAESLKQFYRRVVDLGQRVMALVLQPVVQSILNHLSVPNQWSEICILTGEVMHESEYMRQSEVANNPLLTAMSCLLKCDLAEKFGALGLAEALLNKVQCIGESVRFSHGVIPWYVTAGSTHYRLFHATGKRRHLTKARSFKKQLSRIDALGCPNVSVAIALLDAYEATVRKSSGNHDSAMLRTFTECISIVANSGRVNEEASLNEIAFFACARRKMVTDAQTYLQRALHMYKTEWGSLAKYAWLKETSNVILA